MVNQIRRISDKTRFADTVVVVNRLELVHLDPLVAHLAKLPRDELPLVRFKGEYPLGFLGVVPLLFVREELVEV